YCGKEYGGSFGTEKEQKQTEFDQLIVEKSPTDLKWVSQFNAKRLKLALLVE
ncbi:7526_t:CDS:2, partial [Ambispora leptoticha]